MIPLSSPHVHTQFCDGRSSADEMAQSALRFGFVSLGFSSHAVQDFDMDYAMDEVREKQYIRCIRDLRDRLRGQIRIWLGTERDYFSFADRSRFDYVIGSVHYVPCPDGSKIPVDGPLDLLKDGINRYFSGDPLRFISVYYDLLGRYCAEYKPDMIAHFDLIQKNNKDGALFNPEDPRYFKLAADAMDRAIQGCKLLEINTGGMARSHQQAPYPHISLLRYWRQIGGEIVISSDCHEAKDIAFAYPEAERLAKEAGFRHASFLGQASVLWEQAEF